MNALGAFEESIVSMMPAHQAAAYRAKLTAEREGQTKAEQTLRAECLEVITYCVQALQSPNICRPDMERATAHLSKALAAAVILDPEDA